MALSRSDLTEEVLRKEILENYLTMFAMTKKYNISYVSISQLLKNYDICLVREDLTENALRTAYCINFLSTIAIAKKYHTSEEFVSQSLANYRIEQFRDKIFRSRSDLQLTPLSLAVWFMDDGTCNYSSLEIAGMWPQQELDDIVNYFDERWNINIKVSYEKNSKGRNLRFNKEPAKRFASIIRPYMQPVMMYKLNGVK